MLLRQAAYGSQGNEVENDRPQCNNREAQAIEAGGKEGAQGASQLKSGDVEGHQGGPGRRQKLGHQRNEAYDGKFKGNIKEE